MSKKNNKKKQSLQKFFFKMNVNCEIIQNILIDEYNFIKPIVFLIFEYLETIDGLFKIKDESRFRTHFYYMIRNSWIGIDSYVKEFLKKRNRSIYNYFKYYSYKPALHSTLRFIKDHTKILSIGESNIWLDDNTCKIITINDFKDKLDYFRLLHPNDEVLMWNRYGNYLNTLPNSAYHSYKI